MRQILWWSLPVPALLLLLTPSSWANGLSEEWIRYNYPSVPNLETVTRPACYIETEAGNILNLESLCGPSEETPGASSRGVVTGGASSRGVVTGGAPSGNPFEASPAAASRSVQACYFVDSNGRPCR
ncbi:MAG: hypothetical protein AAFZ80_02390 [Cyanobacteria bacterium P01_A01_bin.105]